MFTAHSGRPYSCFETSVHSRHVAQVKALNWTHDNKQGWGSGSMATLLGCGGFLSQLQRAPLLRHQIKARENQFMRLKKMGWTSIKQRISPHQRERMKQTERERERERERQTETDRDRQRVLVLDVALTLRKESSAPFSMNSVTIMTGRLLVTTPSRRMMLGWSNCPMIDASDRKSRLCFSE